MPLLVKYFDNTMVKSLVDPTIMTLVGASGGKPKKKKCLDLFTLIGNLKIVVIPLYNLLLI